MTAYSKIRPAARLYGRWPFLRKLPAVLLFFFSIHISTNGVTQITLNKKGASLEQVFEELEKQAGYEFLFSSGIMRNAKPVNIQVNNASLQKVLDICFKHQPLRYRIVENSIIVYPGNAPALPDHASGKDTVPDLRVKGKVVFLDSNRVPIPGVNIVNRNTGKGATSDEMGHFEIQAQKGHMLEFSYVGLKTKRVIIADEMRMILVALAKDVDEQQVVTIVSTGYQEIPKERATGSFTHIKNHTIREQVSTGILDRLEAVANSLIADRATSSTGRLMIRGLSTISGPREPLIVVDNFPYEGDISNINPNDIESITILKDAAAASIWGVRAGNGVIVITTRKGRFNQPVSIEVNANVNMADKPDLFYARQMPVSDLIDVERFLFSKGHRFSDTGNSARPPFSPVYEILFQERSGRITSGEADRQIDALKNIDVRNEYLQHVYRKAVQQQYAINIKGGGDQFAWLLSAGYDKNINQLSAGYDRLNLRLHNTMKLLRHLQITTGVYYTQSKTTAGRPGYGQITARGTGLYPYAQFADAGGMSLPVIRNYRQPYLDTAGSGTLLDWNYYPLEDYKHVQHTTHLQDILLNLGLQYRIITGLSADIKYQYERQQVNERNLQGLQSYFTRDMINRFTQINHATGKVTYKVPKGDILDLTTSLLQAHNMRAQLNYDRSWRAHALAIVAGGEIRERATSGNGQRLYGYNNDILQFGNVDYSNTHPTYITGAYEFIPQRISIEKGAQRFVSFFTNAAYTFKNKYTVSISARRDASNLFGLHTNDKWNPLWSSGISWDISREPFYKLFFLPFLKLRATYGFSGNVDPAMTAVTTIEYLSSSPYTLTPTARFNNYYNPELRWETAAQFNVGLDFKTHNARVTGSVEYYHKKGTNLFGVVPIDYTTGVGTTIRKNVASMKGTGVDVELNTVNINKAVTWSTNVNFSFYKDKVTNYHLTSLQASRFVSTDATISGIAGKSVYSIFSYKWAGLDDVGDPLGYLNGEISKQYNVLTGPSTLVSDLRYHGPALPVFFGSIGNTLTWNQLSITARLLYKFGHYFRRKSIDYDDLFLNWQGHADYALRWQKPGDELITQVPALVYTDYPQFANRNAFYQFSETLVEKGDHIRLQYITLSYEIKAKPQQRVPFRTVQVFLNMNNVGIIWRANKHGIDPDYISSFYTIPTPKSMAIGMRATF